MDMEVQLQGRVEELVFMAEVQERESQMDLQLLAKVVLEGEGKMVIKQAAAAEVIAAVEEVLGDQVQEEGDPFSIPVLQTSRELMEPTVGPDILPSRSCRH